MFGLLGGILGGISRNNMLKKQMKMVKEQQAANKAWYDRRYNEDATQRADAQAMLTKATDAVKAGNRAAAAHAAVMGGTEESLAAQRAANAKAISDASSTIAVAGQAKKDAIEKEYRTKDDAYNEKLRELQGAKKSGLDIFNDAMGGLNSDLGSLLG